MKEKTGGVRLAKMIRDGKIDRPWLWIDTYNQCVNENAGTIKACIDQNGMYFVSIEEMEEPIDIRAVGRERTEEEKRRRHLHGDKGASFSKGKQTCILGDVSGCVTTFATKDNQVAEFYMEHQENKTGITLPAELEGKRFRIRKLTPRECFRLMGVDDADIDKIQAFPFESLIDHPAYSKAERFRGMTENEKRAAMRKSISESAQYKLAGNSIVVDVLFHIFRKMFIETDNESQQLTLF